ncbi:MAG: OmpA family protein [Verrucomicrobia bacterium]|nr:OmpA family protein [Verrucomicrobiota bacterium]
MIQSSVQDMFALEPLEPRVLLAADSLIDASSLLPSGAPSSEATVAVEVISAPSPQEEGVAYDPAQRIEDIFNVATSPAVTDVVVGEPVDRSAALAALVPDGSLESHAPVPGPPAEASPKADELTETLHAANGPPEIERTPLEFSTAVWGIHDLLLRTVGGDLELLARADLSSPLVSRPLDEISDVRILGADNIDDTLTIDLTDAPLPSVHFAGGVGGSDRLVLRGSSSASVTHTLSHDLGAISTVLIQAGEGSSTIEHSDVESIVDDLVVENRVFTTVGSNADDLELGNNGDGGNQVSRLHSVSSGLTVDFRNPKASLTLNTGEGDDLIRVATPLNDGTGSSWTIDGGEGTNTLFGPGVDSEWRLSSANGGTLNGIQFTRIGDLVGAADNKDTFIWGRSGALTRGIQGGLGGFDSLLLEGDRSPTLVYNFTDLHSGSVAKDGNTLTYAGLEPLSTIFDPLPEAANDIVLNYDVAHEQRLTIQAGPAGQISVTSDSAEVVTFNFPTRSLTINGSRFADHITLESLGFGFNADLTIHAGAGSDEIIVHALTGVGNYTFDGGTDGGDVLRLSGHDHMTLTDTTLTTGTALATLPTDVNVTRAPGNQIETAIAINPANPKNIIVAPSDAPGLAGGPGFEIPGNGVDDDGDGAVDESIDVPNGKDDDHDGLIDEPNYHATIWVTFDGGATWRPRVIPMPLDAPGKPRGDPSIVFSRDGSRVLYSYMITRLGTPPDTGDPQTAVATALSRDGGATWLAADAAVVGNVFAPFSDDKDFLAVGPDRTNPAQDRFVIAFSRLVFDLDGIVTYTSLNGIDWTRSTGIVSDKTAAEGDMIDAIPAIGPKGQVYLVWEDTQTRGVGRIMFDVSMDGGLTWGQPPNGDREIYTGNLNLEQDPFNGGHAYAIPAQPSRSRGIPMALSMDVDRSGGPHNGRIYVSFTDQADLDHDPDAFNAFDHNDTDIFLRASDDEGIHWDALGSEPVRVSHSSAPGSSQFLGWMDVDQRTGYVGVGWYDTTNDVGVPGLNSTNNTPNDDVQMRASISVDGGVTFAPSIQVAHDSSNAARAAPSMNFGEYNGVAFLDGVLHLAWADNSNSTGDNPDGKNSDEIYYSRVFLKPIILGGIERAVLSGRSLDATGFGGQVVFTSDMPEWVEQGPNPFTSAAEGPTRIADPVAGAIQAVVVDPTDRFTMYLGTVNGGVWRNTGSQQVFFKSEEAKLDSDDTSVLDAFARFLETHPQLTVEIGGHTDSQGDRPYNLDLSRRRAQAVWDYLVNTRRISASRLTMVAYGEDRPVASGGVSGDQPLNRRVELLVNQWEPLTDAFPSLSINSLAISPLDHQVIYAGIGKGSSFLNIGGLGGGLLYSNDRGDSWRLIGQREFHALTITKVLPTTITTADGRQVVFVATYDVDADGDGALEDWGGVFRLEVAPDGATRIKKISNDGNGLPAGSYTDLVLVPGISGDPLHPAVVYAANPAFGIFQYVEGPDNLWQPVNSGFLFGADQDLDGRDDLLQKAWTVKLALHPGSGTLYAAVIGPVDGNGLFQLAGSAKGLIAVFKSKDYGRSWAPMPVPTSVDNGTRYGLNTRGNGNLHFSIAVDPTDPNVVYLGGDTQGTLTNNSAGLRDWLGRVFRWNPTTNVWTQLVGTNANQTGPHADSRGMVFATDYVLLEVDDGGLYRLQNPRGENEQGIRQWASLNRELRITEAIRVGFDPLNSDILVGAQDNGAAFQAGNSDLVDNDGDGVIDEPDERFLWKGRAVGDGNSQAAILYDANGDKAEDGVLRYALFNDLKSLFVFEFAADGAQIDANGTAPGLAASIGFRSGPGAALYSGLNALDAKMGFSLVPMVVNSLDPSRMLVGFNGIYESFGSRLAPGHDRVLPLEYVREIQTGPGVVTSLVYGGRVGRTENRDLIIASRGTKILVRTTADGAFAERVVPGASEIRDITVDPDNWKVVYVADARGVYRIDDVTDNSKPWVDITDNLHAIGQPQLYAIEYVPKGQGVLLVGGPGGVSRLINPRSAGRTALWTRFGTGLPNAPVLDLRFDYDFGGRAGGSEVLIAGTLGRGAWMISGDDMQSIATPAELKIYGTNRDDDFKLAVNPANPLLFDFFDLSSSSTTPVISARGASFEQVQIFGRGGSDTLTMDHSNGAIPVTGGIYYDGGEPTSNRLVLTGGLVASHTSFTTSSGLKIHEITDIDANLERIVADNVQTVDVGSLPAPLHNVFGTLSGGFHSLVTLLTFSEELAVELPFLGDSLGRALNGFTTVGSEGISSPAGGSASEIEPAAGNSSQALMWARKPKAPTRWLKVTTTAPFAASPSPA